MIRCAPLAPLLVAILTASALLIGCGECAPARRAAAEPPCRDRFRISVVAVRDVLTGTIAAVPDPDTLLKESDTLLVAGRDADLSSTAKLT